MTSHETRPTLPRLWVAVATVVGVVIGYTLAVDPVVHSLSQVLYPIVWLGASLIVLWLVREPLRRLTPLPLAVGMGYTLLLLWTAGLLGPPSGPAGTSVHLAMPGWGPAVAYTGTVLAVVLVPFLFVGYVTLGLLAASALQITLQSTAAGVIGLFACVSCTAPLLAGFAGSVGAGSVATTIMSEQYSLATAAFLVSLGSFAVLIRKSDTTNGTCLQR